MIQITIKVDGMRCAMCESHMNDTIRKSFPVKKVTSSHAKGQTVILTETDIADQALRDAVAPTGYQVLSVAREIYEKKGLFGGLWK